METRSKKKSDQKSESQTSDSKNPESRWKGSLPTEKLPSPSIDCLAQKEETLRKKGKREGKTLYGHFENPDQRLWHYIYDADESSDDEAAVERGAKPLDQLFIRVHSGNLKKYDRFEEGLRLEGKRLAQTMYIRNGEGTRHIYDLDEPSECEEIAAMFATGIKKFKPQDQKDARPSLKRTRPTSQLLTTEKSGEGFVHATSIKADHSHKSFKSRKHTSHLDIGLFSSKKSSDDSSEEKSSPISEKLSSKHEGFQWGGHQLPSPERVKEIEHREHARIEYQKEHPHSGVLSLRLKKDE